jgi:SAM-dependent methyltransferase
MRAGREFGVLGIATCALAKTWGVEVQGLVSPGEKLAADSDAYDIVYTANTIHHIPDRASFMAELRRVLRKGGVFYSFDPVAYNPAINIYRRMATDVRTPDEAPLKTSDLTLVRSYFPDVQARYFWLLTLSLFMKYFLVDRVHPNADRYWKRIFRETPQSVRWWLPLQKLDALLTGLPLVKYLSWNVVLWGTKS